MRFKGQVLYYFDSEISLYCKVNSDSGDFPEESNLHCALSVGIRVLMLPKKCFISHNGSTNLFFILYLFIFDPLYNAFPT